MEISSYISIKSATELANNRTKVVTYFNTYAKHYAHEHYSPTSSSLNKYRYHIVLDMISRLELHQNSTTLDIGCGPGHLAIELARMGFDAQGIDISSEMIRIAEDAAKEQNIFSVNFKVGDIESLDYPDNTFNLVTGLGIFEYLETDRPLLAEVNRVLSVGGIFVTNITNLYSYQHLFEPFYRRIKKSSSIRRILSRLKPIISDSKSVITDMNFAPRKHSPSIFQSNLETFGFEVIEDKYIGFSLFPSPFNTLVSRLTSSVDHKLERLDGTFLRSLGACYVVFAKSTNKL